MFGFKTCFILGQLDFNHLSDQAAKLASKKYVQELHTIAGSYDFLARLKYTDSKDLEFRLNKLPKFEMVEQGSQIRRSIKSVKSNIVEGYGRRRYRLEYIRFLNFSIASYDETTDHLETLFETGSLTDESLYQKLHAFL